MSRYGWLIAECLLDDAFPNGQTKVYLYVKRRRSWLLRWLPDSYKIVAIGRRAERQIGTLGYDEYDPQGEHCQCSACTK